MEAWREHTQAHWPTTTALIQRCDVDQYQSDDRRGYYIACRIGYRVGADQVTAEIRSGIAPPLGSFAWPDPVATLARVQDWVDDHPPGTPIEVHYDPGDPKKAVLVTTDMPLGGPRTPGNLRLLGLSAAICVLLLAIAGLARLSSRAGAPS